MPHASIALLSQYLRRLTARYGDPSTDHDLLQRFVACREESAFAALVERHAAMVLGLCRSIVGNHHDAEDIFQAAFLVLARKAGSIRKGESVGSWLYAVAYRLAHKFRIRAGKRRRCAQQAAIPSEQTPMDEVTWGELRDILHEEVSRLPEKYRAAVVLCYWEGRTHEQAGQQLGCARSTIKDRLERAREMLRTRLARRGLTLSAAWFAASLSEGTSAVVSAELVQTTARAAMLFSIGQLPAGSVSASAIACAQEILQGMFMSKLKYSLILALMIGVLGGGAGLAVLRPAATPQAPKTERQDDHRPEEPLPAGAVKRLGTLRFRHGDRVRCIALGADGESVVSVAGKFVYLWDIKSGKERRRFVGHEDEVNSVACSRDGKRIASMSVDGKIHVWDAATGKELRRIVAHKPNTNQVWRSWQMPGYSGLAFTPDGRQLVSRGSDNTIRLWDAATGETKRQFNTFSLLELTRSSALGFTLSPDGKLLVAFEGKVNFPRLQWWDVATGRLRNEAAPKGCVGGAAFSPDSKTLAVCLASNPRGPGDLELWDVASAKKKRAFPLPENERLFAFAPDGKTLILKGEDMPSLRDVQTGKIIGRLRSEHPTLIDQLLFCRDGKTLVSFSHLEHALRLWHRASGKELRSSGVAASPIRCVFSPDGRFLVGGSEEGTIRLWDRVADKEVWRIHQPPLLSALLFSADSRLLATSNPIDPIVRIRDVSDGKEVRQIKTPGRSVARMAWSGDGKALATWSHQDPVIFLWDAATGKQVHRLRCGDAPINALLFSPESKILAAACNDFDKGELLLWSVDKDGRRPPFEGPLPVGLKCLAFSPDGRTVAAGAMDRSVYLWEMISGRKRAALKLGDIATSLAYSPDGKILAAASNTSYRHGGLLDDGVYPDEGKPQPPRIRLWDVASEKRLTPLNGHQGSITSLSFSPDGKLLATGSNDTTVLLWDATRFKTNHLAEVPLRPEQMESLWADLGGADAVKAYRAIRTLAAPKASVAFLKRRLKPVAAADPKQVTRLLAELDSDAFDKREKAMQQLEKLGDSAATELRKALAGKPTLEVKRRIEQLLEKENGGERLRRVRALESLERMRTPEARELCAALANGVADAPLTREAQATLRRLTR